VWLIEDRDFRVPWLGGGVLVDRNEINKSVCIRSPQAEKSGSPIYFVTGSPQLLTMTKRCCIRGLRMNIKYAGPFHPCLAGIRPTGLTGPFKLYRVSLTQKGDLTNVSLEHVGEGLDDEQP